jgi:hypothetical protein
MSDEEPTQRAHKRSPKSARECLKNEIYSFISSYSCINDCKYVVVGKPIDSGFAGIVFQIVFVDSFCERPPHLVLHGCLVAFTGSDRSAGGDSNNKSNSYNLIADILKLPYDKVLYALRSEKGITLITDCDALPESVKRLVLSVCEEDLTNLQYFCLEEITLNQ